MEWTTLVWNCRKNGLTKSSDQKKKQDRIARITPKSFRNGTSMTEHEVSNSGTASHLLYNVELLLTSAIKPVLCTVMGSVAGSSHSYSYRRSWHHDGDGRRTAAPVNLYNRVLFVCLQVLLLDFGAVCKL